MKEMARVGRGGGMGALNILPLKLISGMLVRV
jgi:hypothetical protein